MPNPHFISPLHNAFAFAFAPPICNIPISFSFLLLSLSLSLKPCGPLFNVRIYQTHQAQVHNPKHQNGHTTISCIHSFIHSFQTLDHQSSSLSFNPTTFPLRLLLSCLLDQIPQLPSHNGNSSTTQTYPFSFIWKKKRVSESKFERLILFFNVNKILVHSQSISLHLTIMDYIEKS